MKNKKLIITTAVIVAILAVVGGFFANKYIKKYNQEMQEKQEEQRIANELQSAKEELINYINDDEFVADKELYLSKVDIVSVIDELFPIRTKYDEAISEAKKLAEELKLSTKEAINSLIFLSADKKSEYASKIDAEESLDSSKAESIIASATSENESAFEACKKEAKETIDNSFYSKYIDTNYYITKIDNASSPEEIESIVQSAKDDLNSSYTGNTNNNSGSTGGRHLLGSTGGSTPTDDNSNNNTPSSGTSGSTTLPGSWGGAGTGMTGNPERGDGDISKAEGGGLNLR